MGSVQTVACRTIDPTASKITEQLRRGENQLRVCVWIVKKPVCTGAEGAQYDHLGKVRPIFDNLKHRAVYFSGAPSNIDEQQTGAPLMVHGRDRRLLKKSGCSPVLTLAVADRRKAAPRPVVEKVCNIAAFFCLERKD